MYLIFAGESYYPAGGAWDLIATAETEIKAVELANIHIGKAGQDDWLHIADSNGNITHDLDRDRTLLKVGPDNETSTYRCRRARLCFQKSKTFS